MPARILRTWPAAKPALLAAMTEPEAARRALAVLPIDHEVSPSPVAGGSRAAGAALDAFIADKLDRYAERNHPDDDIGSGLSPYLHFGHVGSHEIAARVFAAAGWTPERLVDARVTGARHGWWGLPQASEDFLDELVTWRELGYGYCFHRDDIARWASLPPWAKHTLSAHAGDPREARYTRAQFETAATHDPLWNAAQRQLVAEGRIHSYLRMLWGKLILAWSRSPRQALQTMIELNNKFGLDGRDPNSYSGISWVLGRFDRPWPERAVFGTVRTMTSASAAHKLHLKGYLARWSA